MFYDGFSISWDCFQLAKRRAMQVARSEDNWNNPSCTFVVPRHGTRHLNLVAVIRREEIRADEEDDDIRGIQLSTDLIMDFFP